MDSGERDFTKRTQFQLRVDSGDNAASGEGRTLLLHHRLEFDATRYPLRRIEFIRQDFRHLSDKRLCR